MLDDISDKSRLYNFEHIGKERSWLRDVLLSDTSSESEVNGDETFQELLFLHKLRKKYQAKFYENPMVTYFSF